MCIGEVTKGQGNVLGAAGVMVPGAAGETNGILEEKYGVPGVSMADGPAGLRLMKKYEVDRTTGQVYVGGFGEENADEVYEPFWFRTFRFVQLEIQAAAEDCIITGFDYLETGYPLEVITHAEGSDDTFASIWDISLRTLKRCMHETYMDCPFYEQLQYAMDARNEILYTCAPCHP